MKIKSFNSSIMLITFVSIMLMSCSEDITAFEVDLAGNLFFIGLWHGIRTPFVFIYNQFSDNSMVIFLTEKIIPYLILLLHINIKINDRNIKLNKNNPSKAGSIMCIPITKLGGL